MEVTFGIVFLGLLVISSAYAIGRTIYERWFSPPAVDETPAVIPFHQAVQLANRVTRQRLLAEAPTAVLVLPRWADGTLAPTEPAPSGAVTVEVRGRTGQPGQHRQRIIARAQVVPPAACPS